MSAQTTYNFATASGVIGGIYDLSPKRIITLINNEENGAMKFGVPVIANDKGEVSAPRAYVATKDTVDRIIGISVNNRTTEMDRDGNSEILKGAPIGVMMQGTIWVDGTCVSDEDATFKVGFTAYAQFDNTTGEFESFTAAKTVEGKTLIDIGAKFVGMPATDADMDGLVPISINR